MRGGLPKGWVEVSLENIVLNLESGNRPKGGVRGIEEGIPSIGGEHLNSDGGFNFEKIKYVPFAFYNKMNKGHINIDDILIVKDGATTGKTSFITNEFPFSKAVVNEHVFLIRCLKNIVAPYLFRYLWSEEGQRKILSNFQGAAQGGINRKFVNNTTILLPPHNEQKRIVAKLNKIIPRVDALRERLDRIPQIIKRFRQSVLTAAVTGKLTEEWRVEHPDIESAKKLLERIKKEREKKYFKECEQAKKEGRKKPKRINLSSQIDTNSIDIELSPKWVPVNLNSICLEIVDCPHSTPKWAKEGKICLRTTNFKPNKLDWSELRYVSKKTYESRIARLKPLMADILYSREGGILGIACMLNKDIDICLGQRMMLLRPSKHIENIYITYLLNSPVILKHVHSLIGGSASPHVNVGAIKNYPIPLPPLEEQREIVRQVNKLFSFADKLETHYKKAKEKIDKLPQSVLAKTFRGELVPQYPNDEPASELLKRIIAEKEKRRAEIKKTKKRNLKSTAQKKGK